MSDLETADRSQGFISPLVLLKVCEQRANTGRYALERKFLGPLKRKD
jgi:hypothetical protein